MRFPQLQMKQKEQSTVSVFGGINTSGIISENEFADMKNITSDFFPGVNCRRARGKVIKTLEKPNGLIWKNGLAYVDGKEFWYDNRKVCEVTDCEKQMIGIGAYICIFPDNIVFNTTDGSVKKIAAEYVQGSNAVIEPVSEGSVFVKISCTGIGKSFAVGDGVFLEGFTTFPELLNTSKIIQERSDDFIVISAAGVNKFTQETGIRVQRKMPDIDFVTEYNNRLWACSSKAHEIYGTKLGDPLNWYAYEGLSTDSYAATVGSDGDFTGAVTHLGYVLFFKEDCVHQLYGTKPSNIQIDTTKIRGVAKGCEKSLCIVDETLYYAARNDICAFERTLPYSVSEKLTDGIRYKAAVAQQNEGSYYISLKGYDNRWTLYVYDVKHQLWFKEDDTQFLYTAYAEGKLYYIDGDGRLRTLYDDTGAEKERVQWYLETGDLEEGSIDKKKTHKLQIMAELERRTLFEVYVQYDADPLWSRVCTIEAEEKGTTTIPLKLKRCGHYRIRLSGAGGFKLYAINRITERGSYR